jgi:hypothetical protein
MSMFDDIDWSVPESVESCRRSVAMLQPDAWVLKREPALAMLERLLEALKQVEDVPDR